MQAPPPRPALAGLASHTGKRGITCHAVGLHLHPGSVTVLEVPRRLRFGKYGLIPNERESYEEGFKIGRTWQHCHTPYGPYVFSRHAIADPVWKLMADQSEKNNAAWQRGWRDGLTEKRRQGGRQ